MRILLYTGILVALLFAPVQRLDVAQLEPVQTVAVSVADDLVVIKTDTNNKGQGKELLSAIRDLEKNTPGVIYLDTAQYLLITESAQAYAQQLEGYLRPSVKVSLWDGNGSVKKVAKFLEKRSDLPTLRQWNRGVKKPVKKS